MPDGQARFLVLGNRSFLLLWGAQAISQTAHNVLTFTLLVEVGQLSRSSTQASLVVLSFIVPGVLFGPIAGVFVDRSDKRKVLLVTNLLRSVIHSVLNILLDGSSPRFQTTLTLVAVMLLATGLGIGSTFVSVPAQTLLQEWSPVSLRGRVFAALFTLSSALAILPVLFSGVLADLIGLQKVLALIGLSTLALGVSGRYSRTRIRRRRHRR